MYEVLIGFNVRLEAGEAWPGSVIEAGDEREARFEAGERLETLPKLADANQLIQAGVIRPVKAGKQAPRGGEV